MATQKPDLTRIWANGAPPGNVVDPDTTTPGKVLSGWQAEVPPFEHFNFLQKWFTQGLAHNNEQGINVWDTNTVYPVNALVKGSDGIIYKSILEQSGEDPTFDDGTNWTLGLSNDKYYSRNFKTVSDMKSGLDTTGRLVNMTSLVGSKVFWRGYYSESDGGSNWGIVKSGAHTEDNGSIFSIDVNTYIEANHVNRVIAAKFGMKFDNSDEVTQFTKWIDFTILNGFIADGQNKTIRTSTNKTYSPTKTVTFKNWDIITGNDYTDQCNITFATDVELRFKNIHVDGERNTRAAGTEPWSVFANFGGVDSIQPLGTGRFISTNIYITSSIHIDNMSFSNYHGAECIKMLSYGTVNINKFKARFCSNKTFHIWHSADAGSDPDTGITIAKGIDLRDCGIMVSDFLVDGVARTRADNYAPQGAFGAIVTFGRYILNGCYINNYGATGVTGDRNINFTHSDITIVHNDVNAFNNNPSGAFWNENCGEETGNGLTIKVTARDVREDTTDNSLLQTFIDGGTSNISNVTLTSEVGSNINKVIRGSHGAGAIQIINGYNIDATGADSAAVIANVSGQSKKISLTGGTVSNGDMEIRDSLNIVMDGLDSDGLLTIKPIIPTPLGDVTLKNVVASGGNLTLDGVDGTINISGGKFTAIRTSALFGSNFDKMTIDGGCNLSQFNSIITGGNELVMGEVKTVRRVEIKDVTTAIVNGGVYKTDVGEAILWFNPTAPGIMLRASVMGAAIWIKTGTGGAGYTQFEANVGSSFDNGNDKANVAWT